MRFIINFPNEIKGVKLVPKRLIGNEFFFLHMCTNMVSYLKKMPR
mgnify:CR=1 FL=1